MTFLTGPNINTKSAPLIEGKSPEHRVEMRMMAVSGEAPRHGGGQLVRAVPFLLTTMVLLVGCGLLLSMLPLTPPPARYQGFCTIPIKDTEEMSMLDQPMYKVMPLRWSQDEADIQVLNGGMEAEARDLLRSLREHFDIGDHVEKITVMDNGRSVNFIHNFELNTTGIEDTERCFTGPLDRGGVLAPEVLVLSIAGGAQFDVSRARHALRAQLPPLDARSVPQDLQPACSRKPVYRLLREEYTVRKRSADEPSHDYIQFSGQGVQEIDISNLAEVLQHEQDSANAQR